MQEALNASLARGGLFYFLFPIQFRHNSNNAELLMKAELTLPFSQTRIPNSALKCIKFGNSGVFFFYWFVQQKDANHHRTCWFYKLILTSDVFSLLAITTFFFPPLHKQLQIWFLKWLNDRNQHCVVIFAIF